MLSSNMPLTFRGATFCDGDETYYLVYLRVAVIELTGIGTSVSGRCDIFYGVPEILYFYVKLDWSELAQNKKGSNPISINFI